MKRTIAMLFAALLMVLTVPATARAADDVTLIFTADKSTVNPGDTITFTVSIGPVGELGLGGLEFDLLIPEGLTIIDESVSIPEGLADIFDTDADEIVMPRNGWAKWSHSARKNGYTGASEFQFLTFSCTVDANIELGEKSLDVNRDSVSCFDNSLELNDYNTVISPASFTVEKAKIPVSSVALDQNTLTLKEGETAKLTATVVPADADNTAVTWSSDNSSVAGITADGTVTAVKAGTANITVTTEDGGKTASCAVTVTCTHNMEKTDAVAPTCGKEGNIEYYTCTKCGKKFADEAGAKEITDAIIPATGQHGETEIRGAVEATEEKEGYTGDTYCKVCGNKIADGTVIPKLPHTHVMTKTEAVEPDCEKDGNVEYYTCSKCGKIFTDEAGTKELTDVVVRAKGHTGNEWLKDEKSHWKVCSVCGKEFTRGAHVYKWVVDKAATEDETGLAHEECEACGSRRNEGTVTDKLDHVHTDIQHHEASAATCIAKGNVEYWTCSSKKCEGKYYGDAACQVALEGIETPVNSNNHVGNGKWDRTAEKHIYTCACGAVLTDEAHKYASDNDADCDVCGYRRFYAVTAGANAVYEIGNENGLSITADGDYGLFKELQVDGSLVDAANYEVKEGSTVITLKKSYLDTLSPGEHTIRFVYTDGKTASASFTVKAKDNTDNNSDNNTNNNTGSNTDSNTQASQEQDGSNSPKTGDENRLIFWVLLAVSSMGLIAGLVVYERKQKKK